MILSKSQLVNNITTEISDNSDQAITPYHIRHNLIDLIDSTSQLLIAENIVSKNVKTLDVRSSVVGDRALERSGLSNHTTVDNSAFGFSAMRMNFQGARNTSIGSYSLQSNITGSDNIAIGLNALSANTSGGHNVGIGNFSLLSNRTGSFNIAIGHGAGYYIDQDADYQFYLGSANVDIDSVCSDPAGDNITPLLRGDLQNNTLGINTQTLLPNFTLQIGGSSVPTEDNSFNFGSSSLAWSSIYSNNLYFNADKKFSLNSNDITFNFNLIPETNSEYNIGSSSNTVNYVYTSNLIVDGTATINAAELVSSSYYLNKTLNLATRPVEYVLDGGGPYSIYDYALSASNDIVESYLDKSQVDGAGLIVYVDDVDIPIYEFVANTSEQEAPFWKSNLSLDIGSGNYVKTDKIISRPEFSVDFGENTLSLKDNYLYFGDKFAGENNTLGFGNVNFYSDNQVVSSYLCSNENNTRISHRFFSDASGPESGGSYTGFEMAYENRLPSENLAGHIGFSIKAFSHFVASKTPSHSLFLSRDDSTNIFAISDIHEYEPEATADFNIQDSCSVRIKSRGNNKTSKVKLENEFNNAEISLSNSLELSYKDVVTIRSSDSHLDILNNVSGTHNFDINIGDKLNNSASIGMRHSDSPPVSASGYGGLFVKSKNAEAQKSTLIFMDEIGNEFELIRSPNNSADGFLFIKDHTTAGGLDSLQNKETFSGSDNTGVGFSSLKNISTGSKNTLFGSNAGKELTTGNNNVAIGYNVLSANKTNSFNVCIGGEGVGSSIDSNYNFILGATDELVLMRGALGPNNSNKFLELPNDGKLLVSNSTNTESVQLTSNRLTVIDKGGADYPDYSFDIVFTGNNSSSIISLDHSDDPISKSPVFKSVDGPQVQLNANVKVLGSILFSDGSELKSALSNDRIPAIENNVSDINDSLDSMFVEGFASSDIDKPSSYAAYTQGTIVKEDGSHVTIVHRDPFTAIKKDSYVMAVKINSEYRPIRIGSKEALMFCG